MLYRLLTGVLPFRQEGGQIAPLMQDVMHSVPRAPSAAVVTRPDPESAVAAHAVPTADRLARRAALRGDLDDIVLMALRKEPEQRYRTVSELAADIDAYLEQRPVRAHGGNRTYRVRKFVARHRMAVALASLALLSIVVGGAATTRASWRAQQSAARSVREAQKASAIQQFLQQMLASADPLRTGGDVSVREALDRAASALDTAFLKEPEIRAGLWSTVGQTYMSLGAIREGERYLDSALVAYTRLGEPYSRDAYAAHAALVTGYFAESRFTELREAVAAARPGYEQAFGALDSTTLQLSAYDALGAFGTGAMSDAVDSLDAVLPKLRRVLGDAAPSVAMYELALANILALQAQRTSEALELIRHGLRSVESLGPTNATYLLVQGFAVEGLARLGKPDEAEAMGREMVMRHTKIWGEGSVSTFGARRLLALALLENQRADTAVVVLESVVRDASRLLAPDHPSRVMLEQDYATLLLSFGRAEEAEQLLRAAHGFHVARDGERSPKALLAYQNLAGAVRAQGRIREALDMVETVVQHYQSAERGSNDLYFAVLQLADLRQRHSGDSASLAVLNEYLPSARERLPRGNRALNMLLTRQAQVLVRANRTAEAETALREVRDNYLAERGGNEQHPDVVLATQALALLREQITTSSSPTPP
jgi:tetratricopeptide (TPR) repeat protein